MDAVVDRLVQEVNTMIDDGDFAAVGVIVNTSCWWDDPMIVTTDEYPYFYVAPVSDTPKSETVGRTGYDVLLLTIQIGLVIIPADYFDPTESESPGTKAMVKAVGLIKRRLRRLSKKNLDNLPGVRNVVVGATNYVPDVRNESFVKLAVITLVVEKQYQHEE
jgi:hypothetical protein